MQQWQIRHRPMQICWRIVVEALAEVSLQHGYDCLPTWLWPECPKIGSWGQSQVLCDATLSAGQNYDYWPGWWLYPWSECWHATKRGLKAMYGVLHAYINTELIRRRESYSSASQMPIDCVSWELEKIENKSSVKKILLWFLQCTFSANNTWEAARNNSWGA